MGRVKNAIRRWLFSDKECDCGCIEVVVPNDCQCSMEEVSERVRRAIAKEYACQHKDCGNGH